MQRQFEEGTTLDRFIFETTKEHADATGQFADTDDINSIWDALILQWRGFS